MAFNVFEFATNQTKYAERHPVVYMNGRAAQEILDLKNKLDDRKSKPNTADEKKIRARIKELQKELDASKLIFNVRGYATSVRTTLEEGVRAECEKDGKTKDETDMAVTFAVFAKAIESVTSPDGEVDTQEWTADNVRDLMESAPPGALTQFTEDILHVTVRAIEFDKSVDVTF